MAYAYLGLGGNVGDPRTTLQQVVDRLRPHGELTAVSSLYETAPVGFLDQPPFLNATVALQTDLCPEALLSVVLKIERSFGRLRTFRNAPRTVDIDVLLYDGVHRTDGALSLPHPRMHERPFVLVPLAEIAPDVVHPLLNQTIRELLLAFGDVSDQVHRVAGPEWAAH